ncbi:MAG: DUF86 domain-containing protein [Thermoplasmata archaeon]|nr:DUF86 domain-containing protein [Thermoplasmata archaeon]
MTDPTTADQRRIDDMLDMLRDIREQLRVGREVFVRDRNLQKVVAYDLMILGEAASKVSQRTQKRNPKVPWTELATYRNELIHEYGSLALEETWEFAQRELRQIEKGLGKVRVMPPGE